MTVEEVKGEDKLGQKVVENVKEGSSKDEESQNKYFKNNKMKIGK